jgi:hypothetical protein
MTPHVRAFLETKVRTLRARARRLGRLDHNSVGIRPQDLPYVPSAGHFAAANRRLAEIDREVARGLDRLSDEARSFDAPAEALLRSAALVEREVDRARRAFALFFDVFSQRGSSFGPALAACDAIASDCFRAVRRTAPGVLRGALLTPVTYLEHGFSPATFRRGVLLGRLLGERNPFPLVRIPYEHAGSPWGMGVVLHELGHNLHADMGIWLENRSAVQRRVLNTTGDPWITRIWTRWHKEIFADLIALLLGGPAVGQSMMDFLSHPSPRVLTFRPLSVHPTAYLRTLVMAEMVRRMGFDEDAKRMQNIWNGLYGPQIGSSRIPRRLLQTASRVIPHVVDEIAFQTRRGLGQLALADVVSFSAADEQSIRAAAPQIAGGRVPTDLPPRFTVSASRYAMARSLAPPAKIAAVVLGHLARLAARGRSDANTAFESSAA